MAKYLSNRQKNLKIGIVSYTESNTVLEVTGKVGIGTTNAQQQSLYVVGDGYFSGDLRVSGVATYGSNTITIDGDNNTITVGSGVTISSDEGITTPQLNISGTLFAQNINVGGASTLASNGGITTTGGDLYVGRDAYIAQNFVASGIATVGSLSIGSTQVISSARQLQNIASLDSTTTATIEAAIANAPNTFSDLNVTGISTLGVTSATNLTAQQLNVSGVSTFAGITTVTGTTLFAKQLNVSGVSTLAGKIVSGNGIGNTNLANTLNYSASTGITAFRPISLVDSAAGIKISRTGGQTLGAALELQTWDVGIVTNYSYWDVNAQSGYFGIRDIKNSRSRIFIDDSGSILLGATSSNFTTNYNQLVGVGTDKLLNVLGNSYISGSVGIGSTTPTSKLSVVGDGNFTGVVTATTFIGSLTGIAASATQLVTPRTFEITGDVVASPISFDGTGNVSLAATIQPNSVGLGTDTFGDYVKDITGTANQITVTSGTGEGSSPTLSIPSQFTAPQDVTVSRDLQVNRNLNVIGNITIGGTSATLFTETLKISDSDIILGFRTDAFGNDVSNDTTANHGGIAVASTEGNPLVRLVATGIETLPPTYKKIMWFKAGSFAGLGTDAWLFNYGVGIGSTQFPTGTRLAAGSVQFTERDLAVVRNINASGVVTATTFVGALTGTATSTTNIPNLSGDVSSNNTVTTLATVNSNIGTFGDTGAIPSITVNAKGLVTGVTTVAPNNGQLSLAVSGIGLTGSATFTANQSGSSTFTVTSNATDANTPSTIVARDASGNFSATTITGNLTGTATTATNLADAANITTGTINSARLSGTYNINVSYANTAGIATVAQGLTGTPNITVGVVTATRGNFSGIITSSGAVISGVTTSNGFNATTGNDYKINGTSVLTSTTLGSGVVNSSLTSVGTLTNLNVGNINSTGIITATSGNFSGIITSSGAVISGVSTISVNSTASALRITQLGSGNALVVEDSTNPDATPFVVNADGSVGIGTTNPEKPLHLSTSVATPLIIQRTSTNNSAAEYRNTSGSMWAGLVSNATGWGVGAAADLSSDAQILVTRTGGELLVGSLSTTGTASQKLQVTGGAYVSGSVGIGVTNPQDELHLGAASNIGIRLQDTAPGGGSYATINYNDSGSGINALTLGADEGNTGTNTEIRFNIDGSEVSRYAVGGQLLVGTSVTTGTANQKLQVTGGAYVSENIGIGTTNPTSKLSVVGDGNFTGVVTASSFSGNASSATFATTAGIATFATSSGIATFATTAGVSTSVSGGTASVTQLNVSGVSTIGVNTSSNALRITQLGSGNALVVEDETNPDATPFVVNASGQVGIGTTNPARALDVQGSIYIRDTTGNSTFTGPGNIAIKDTTDDGFISFHEGDGTRSAYIQSSDTNGFLVNQESSLPLFIRTEQSQPIVFETTNIERIRIQPTGNVGIGTTNPTSKLSVVGDGRFTGVVTASSFSGNASSATFATTAGIATFATSSGIATFATNAGIATFATNAGIATFATSSGIATYADNAGIATFATSSGIATFATNAGVSTNIKGGLVGNIPYQSAADTTVFLANGSSGTILQSNGVGNAPSWITAAPADAITGLTVRDEGTIVGGANSVSQFDFVGSNISVASTAGIATITIADNLVGTALSISGISTFTNGPVLVGSGTSTGTASQRLQVTGGAYVSGSVGIGSTTPTSKLSVVGDGNFTGVVTATTFFGALTGTATTASSVTANSVGLGTGTFGDYVRDITGTANQITVTGGTGEGSTPTLSIPSQFTAPQDVTVSRDLQVNRNLNVTGNITIGGTSATLFTETLKISDSDIILGFRTDGSGNDVSNDTTANHGGIAVASTEGTPLVRLVAAGIETLPPTYKKIMWFKAGTFSGLGTDAWLFNYAVGIGSTQVPNGVRLAAGGMQVTDSTISSPQLNISGVSTLGNTSATNLTAQQLNISGVSTFSGITTHTEPLFGTQASFTGVVTASSFSGNASSATFATTAGIATFATNAGVSTSVIGGIGSITQLSVSGITTTGTLNVGTGGTIITTTTGGLVGINTTNPQSALDVRGAITVGVGTVGINSVLSTTDIQSWYYTNKSKNIGTLDDGTPTAVYVGAAGTTMFVVGDGNNRVFQYTLSTPYDVSTAGVAVTFFSTATQDTNPAGIDFNPTGTKMFISGLTGVAPLIASGEYVHEYSLSTAWDVSPTSVGYTTSYNVTQDTSPQGVTFGNSGSKMYVCGATNDTVYQYSLSTPYSIASGVTYDNISLVLGTAPLLLETGPVDISFNSTGTVLWVIGQANDRIYEFRLGTAWDISTAVFYDDVYVGFLETTPTGLQVIPEQNVAYIVGSGNDTVYQYSTNTPALEIASSGISTVSSIVLNNETRVKDKLYVKGDAHFDNSIVTQGNLNVAGVSTLTGAVTASSTLAVTSTLTASAAVTFDTTTSAINQGTSQTTGTFTIGGTTTATGTITVGRGTTTQTTNIQAGATVSGQQKTINLGTGGLAGSRTLITVGSAVAGAISTVTIPSPTNLLIGIATTTGTASQQLQVNSGAYVSGNLGIGSTNPTSKLSVVGDGNFTGVVTATTFVGALTGTATSTTNIPNLTGAITSNNTTTALGSFTSAQLATALTDETGSGAAVFATSPTLVTPILGAASATSIVVGSGVTINASGINASAGIVTATSFSGSGTNLTGIVTSIVAGTNITVSGSTGQVTINSTATGGSSTPLDILEVMLFA